MSIGTGPGGVLSEDFIFVGVAVGRFHLFGAARTMSTPCPRPKAPKFVSAISLTPYWSAQQRTENGRVFSYRLAFALLTSDH